MTLTRWFPPPQPPDPPVVVLTPRQMDVLWAISPRSDSVTDFPDFDGTQNCAQPGVDAELFFPHQNGSGARARRVCLSDKKGNPCPFLVECREYSVTHSVLGVWGAWSDEERRADRKARRIVPIPLAFREASGAEITTSVLRKHGSWAGVGQHERYKEKLCEECREYRNGRRRRLREGRAS